MRAKKGSGGVGCFVRNSITQIYNVSIIDETFEGILWLKFCPRTNDKPFYCCICYLPPSDSTRNIDPGEFYDTLLFQIHSYCKDDFFYLCGDFNGRCGDLEDFIAGVDSIPDRNVVDYTINKECERFCEFLIDSNCCMTNGRNCQNNDFTFISTSGSSVIDYCVVPYEYLSNIQDFSVHPTSALISVSNIHCTLDSPGTYPDHSLLVWTISVENTVMCNRDSTSRTASFEVFDRNIPTDFLDGQSEVLNTYISQIEQDVSSQEELDNIYSHLMQSIKEEMVQSLSHKTVKVKSGSSNRKRKTKKPWWTSCLTELWNDQCDAEQSMLKSKSRTERKGLRKRFIEKRKLFNREVQRSKRAYALQRQAEIDNLEATNPNLFWKEIGKIGIGQERRKFIPMEVTRDDGSLSSNTDEVLNKWNKKNYNMILSCYKKGRATVFTDINF